MGKWCAWASAGKIDRSKIGQSKTRQKSLSKLPVLFEHTAYMIEHTAPFPLFMIQDSDIEFDHWLANGYNGLDLMTCGMIFYIHDVGLYMYMYLHAYQ